MWWQVDDWRRHIGLPVAVLVGTVGLGAVIGTALGVDGGSGSTPSAYSRLDALAPGTVEKVSEAAPTELTTPRAIGSEHAGIAVLAASEPDAIDTKDGRRRAPDGGTLVVFTLGDWGCEDPPCKPWTSLEPKLQVDSLVKDLPTGGDTFVVAAPPGTSELRLVVEDAGYRQSVSLLDDDPGSTNIALLAQRHATRKLELGKAVRLDEQTDIQFRAPDGGLVDRFVRNATVDYAQRRFFYGDLRPKTASRAFLIVSASYSYPGKTQRYAFASSEVAFVDDRGKSYPATSDQRPGSSLLTFEIPGSVTSGTLVLGGSSRKTATNGVPYTSTISEARVRLRFR